MPRLFPKKESLLFNRARVLSEGEDVTILTCSICTEEGLRAVTTLKAKGVSVHHLHVSTLKPFSDPAVLEAISRSRNGVITMENHSIIGGLGSAVAELMAEHAVAKPLLRLGLNDTYAHGASLHYLMHEYGLNAASLVRAVEKLLGVHLDIDARKLEAEETAEMDDSEKVEAL
jgi:transketolase